MKVDMDQLLVIFDELLTESSDLERGVYWFRFYRSDGIKVTLTCSAHECYVDIIIRAMSATVGVSLEHCSEIRVVDESRKHLEILYENSIKCCSLILNSNNILDYQNRL